MLMPKAARERIAIPPAGTALAPLPGLPPGQVLYVSENRNVPETVTIVNENVTTLSAVMAGS
jgi:hypothetical protein